MGETKFTPGPWSTDPRLFSSTSCVSIYDAQSNDIACVEKGYETGRGGWVELPAMENARLIAAAPDLLEKAAALLAAIDDYGVKHWDTDDFPPDVQAVVDASEAARAAIAKATGADNG